MIDIQKLQRDNIRNLQPYSSARLEFTGKDGIFLDANENALGSVFAEDYSRYPDPVQAKLKETLAAIKKVNPKNIFIGNGSDEAIDLLIRSFCEPGEDSILIMPPTYGMYEVCADINNVPVKAIPLTPDFEIDRDSVLDNLTDDIKLIFICSPNNPSGNLLKKEAIGNILKNTKALVIVDEAYIDFAQSESWISELSNFSNLVVLQTFSKAWGLANLRVGMAYAHPDIISVLNKVKYPYNVNGYSQKMALEALALQSRMEEKLATILVNKKHLIQELESTESVETIFPSDANFLLVRFTQAEKLFSYLIENKMIIRDRSKVVHGENCLRITVGTESDTNRLMNLISKWEKNK